jgi:hypothetical protein
MYKLDADVVYTVFKFVYTVFKCPRIGPNFVKRLYWLLFEMNHFLLLFLAVMARFILAAILVAGATAGVLYDE